MLSHPLWNQPGLPGSAALFLVLLLMLSSTANLAATLPPSPPRLPHPIQENAPDQGQKSAATEKPTCRLRLSGRQNQHPIPFFLWKVKSPNPLPEDLNKRLPLLIQGDIELSLPQGFYEFEVNAGPRHNRLRIPLDLKEGKYEHTVEFAAFFSVRSAGWLQWDPFCRVRIPPNANPVRWLPQWAAATDCQALGLPSPLLEQLPVEAYRPDLILLHSVQLLNGRIYGFHDRPIMLPSKRAQRTFLQQLEQLADLHQQGVFLVWNRPGTLPVKSGSGRPFTATEQLLRNQQALVMQLAALCALLDGIDISRLPDDLRIWRRLNDHQIELTMVSGGPQLNHADPHEDTARPALYLPEGIGGTGRELRDNLSRERYCLGTGGFVELRLGVIDPGDRRSLSPTPQPLYLRALAGSDPEDTIASMQLIYNGKTVLKRKGEALQRALWTQDQIRLDKPGWLLGLYHNSSRSRFALTKPIRIIGDTAPPPALLKSQVRIILLDRHGQGCAGKVVVSNLGRRLGTFSIPSMGKTLHLPATARLFYLRKKGGKYRQVSLFKASGLEKWLVDLAGNLGRTQAFLSGSDSIQRLRGRLQHVDVRFQEEGQ